MFGKARRDRLTRVYFSAPGGSFELLSLVPAGHSAGLSESPQFDQNLHPAAGKKIPNENALERAVLSQEFPVQ